jgi:hypothetical protein
MFCKNCGQEIKIGNRFCTDCGQEIKYGKFFILKFKTFEWIKNHQKLLLISFLVIVLLLVFISVYGELSKTNFNTKSNLTEKASFIGSYNQNEITSSVVNIFCPSTEIDEEVIGGSGTIISEDGLILTNSHIIPQDETDLHISEEGCMVVLPDPITGQPKDIYLAKPIVIQTLSDQYDLAFMSIYAAYYDEESDEYGGVYPRVFPAFDDTTRCKNENVQLGEPVRIFGYPAISGGYSLTITDGIVSSLPGDGLIITSAKISYGNSGGLAINRNGCMLGIPSMVNSDENESLGIIISMQLINEFYDEVVNNTK